MAALHAGGGGGDRLAGAAGDRAARVGRRSLQARQHTLQVAARFAASEILKEINLRFDILDGLAADDELRQQMIADRQSPERRRRCGSGWRTGSARARPTTTARCLPTAGSSTMRAACRSPAARAAKRAAARIMRTATISTVRARICRTDTTDLKPIAVAASVGRVSQHVDRASEGGVFGADRKRRRGARRARSSACWR